MSFKSKNKKREVKKDLEREIERQRDIEIKEQERDNQFKREKEYGEDILQEKDYNLKTSTEPKLNVFYTL